MLRARTLVNLGHRSRGTQSSSGRDEYDLNRHESSPSREKGIVSRAKRKGILKPHKRLGQGKSLQVSTKRGFRSHQESDFTAPYEQAKVLNLVIRVVREPFEEPDDQICFPGDSVCWLGGNYPGDSKPHDHSICPSIFLIPAFPSYLDFFVSEWPPLAVRAPSTP